MIDTLYEHDPETGRVTFRMMYNESWIVLDFDDMDDALILLGNVPTGMAYVAQRLLEQGLDSTPDE